MIWFSLIFCKFLSLPVLNYSFRIGLKIDFFQQGIFEIVPWCYMDDLDKLINAIFGINHRQPVGWLVSSKIEVVYQ